MKKLKVWIEGPRIYEEDELELPSNWDTVSWKRQQEIADSMWSDWMSNYVSGGHEVVEVEEVSEQ